MAPRNLGHLVYTILLLLILSLVGCGGSAENGRQTDSTATPAPAVQRPEATDLIPPTPTVPLTDLNLIEEEITVVPQPLRAGFPFTITATIHNRTDVPATDVPLLFHISANQEEFGYTSFLQVLTVTIPASQTVAVTLPVSWNFAGGEHQLWVQANRLPEAWQDRFPTQPETNISDNRSLQELMIDPFDAYVSELCPGRVDLQISPADVLPEPDHQRVLVRVHNSGNRAAYNLPVVVTGDQLSGLTYTSAIPPCGGTTEVYVEVDRPLQQGETRQVQVNPVDWPGGLEEDDYGNNHVAVASGLAPGLAIPSIGELEDYDFSIATTDIETPELWIVLVTVHNLGTRDADMVPIRVENEAGRKITDAVPLVQGGGLGVVAIRVGYLWTRGGILTFTVNPEDAKGAYPEVNRNNNTATFTLP